MLNLIRNNTATASPGAVCDTILRSTVCVRKSCADHINNINIDEAIDEQESRRN